jgi:hypothetical protein
MAVTNTAPVVNAGADLIVDPNLDDSFLLNAIASDSDGTIASYLWEDITGTPVTIAGTGSSRVVSVSSLRSPLGKTATYRVTVTDNAGAVTSDTVVVTVLPHTAWLKSGSVLQAIRRAKPFVYHFVPTPSKIVQQVIGSAASATGFTTSAITTSSSSILLLVVGRSGGTATGALTSVTDQKGNTWQVVTRGSVSGASNSRVEVWYTVQNASGLTANTISVTSATAQTSDYSIVEISGLDKTALVDVVSPDNSGVTSATPSTPAVQTTSANDMVFSVIHHSYNAAADTVSAPSGVTTLTPSVNGTVHVTSIAWWNVSSIGSYNATWARGGAVSGATGTITFALRRSVQAVKTYANATSTTLTTSTTLITRPDPVAVVPTTNPPVKPSTSTLPSPTLRPQG